MSSKLEIDQERFMSFYTALLARSERLAALVQSIMSSLQAMDERDSFVKI